MTLDQFSADATRALVELSAVLGEGANVSLESDVLRLRVDVPQRDHALFNTNYGPQRLRVGGCSFYVAKDLREAWYWERAKRSDLRPVDVARDMFKQAIDGWLGTTLEKRLDDIQERESA